ncbi:MAG: DUF3347 domain-containing protein [Ferruginibacter sp.]
MKKIISFLILALGAFSVYWFLLRTKEITPKAPKMQPIALKKHSDSFNLSITNLMDAYLGIKESFVSADTGNAKRYTGIFISLLDSISVKELEKDDAMIAQTAIANIADIKANAVSLLQQRDITQMRVDFRTLSDMMYPGFFKIINYEGPTLYLQNCPMAFDGDKDANWISNSNKVVNPYLGNNHPKYKATMINCGEVKDSIGIGF